jgi:hypothetical protein
LSAGTDLEGGIKVLDHRTGYADIGSYGSIIEIMIRFVVSSQTVGVVDVETTANI